MRRTRWRGLSHQSGDAREIPVRHLKREWNLRSGQNRRDLLTSAGTANARETRMNPVDAYPGDEYVDVIGMDFYYNIQWNPADSRLAWDEMVNAPFGLKWLEEFAAAHNKPTAYPEWGVNSTARGPILRAPPNGSRITTSCISVSGTRTPNFAESLVTANFRMLPMPISQPLARTSEAVRGNRSTCQVREFLICARSVESNGRRTPLPNCDA